MSDELKDIFLGSWKDIFEERILQRGFDYFDEGRVWDINVVEDCVEAVVSGTEEYDVIIRFDVDGITDLQCSCPYAEDGSHCKHEAAVLYALSEDTVVPDNDIQTPVHDYISKIKKERTDFRKLIDQIPEKDVRDLLYESAYDDSHMYDRIMSRYSGNIDKYRINELKNSIRSIKDKYSDRGGFVDWENASDYITELCVFLNSNVSTFIERGILDAAFDLTCTVFVTMGTTDIDDDGDIAYGAEDCCRYWAVIAEKASDEYQKTMYEWFMNTLHNDSVYDYMRDYLEEFVLHNFHSEELLRIRMADIDKMIGKQEKTLAKNIDDRWDRHLLEKYVLSRVQTMKELDIPKAEIDQFYRRYDNYSDVRLEHADYYQINGETEKAVELLETGKDIDSEDHVAISEYSGHLIDIYSKEKKSDRQIEELKYNIFTCYQNDLQYVCMLKGMVDDAQWIDLRTRILMAGTCRSIHTDILAEEGMLQELLQEALDYEGIYLIERYEKQLRKKYPEEIRNKYAAYVCAEADHVSDRKQYRKLMKELKKLTRYVGGRALAQEIAVKWRDKYSRRPAFIDELQKTGFLKK